MKDGHSAPDLWHLTIDDLLTPPPETPRLGGAGPFVINLSASTAPIGIPTEKFPGLEQLRIYQVKRTENNRWRFRLRIGLINTELEADAILAVVREHYPSAFTATAGDDDARAVSEASRTAQARRAHVPEMIADKPDEDAEPPKAAPKATPKAVAAPAAAQPTRWVIMQAPEKKTPPPREETDVDPNAVTDQVAILKLPEDEVSAELTLDDVPSPPAAPAPKAEAPKKAQPPQIEPPKKAEQASTPEPVKKAAAEIPAELRPLFEPTRKAAARPATMGDLQAIADLVVIDHDDTLESVVLKNNTMVNSLEARVEAPVPNAAAIVAAVATDVARADVPVARGAPVVAPKPAADEPVPELSVEITDLPIALAPAAIVAPVSAPVPVLTEAVPVVAKSRTTVVGPSPKASEPPAKVAGPTKLPEPPVLTAAVVAPVSRVVAPAKIAKPVAKVVEPTKVTEPVARTAEPAKTIGPVAKTVEPATVVAPTQAAEPAPRTVRAQLVQAAGPAHVAKTDSKSHRAIARMHKAAAKQSKALNRSSKEVAKATKASTPPAKAAHAPRVEPPKAAARPPKTEAHPPKAAAHPPRATAHPPKAPPAPKANGHALLTGDASLHGHGSKANGHAHAPQKLNGHAPKAPSPAPAVSEAPVTATTPPPSLADQAIARVLEPAREPVPVQKPIEILTEPLPPVDSTQTIRALTPLELVDDDGSRWFSIQLSLSEDEVNPETVPHLDIFDEYRLYSVAGLDQGKFMHALRLGFFADEGSAHMVAGYLRCYFDEPSVKRVSIAERERFSGKGVVARRDIGATGTHTIIELATAPPVPETTLADLSHSAIRRMPEDASLLSRLFAQLKR